MVYDITYGIWNTELRDYGTQDCRIQDCGIQDYRSMEYGIVEYGIVDYKTIGLWDYNTTQPQDYRII